MSIFEILNNTPETTKATTPEATADLASEVKKLSEQIKIMALQVTNPAEYAEMIAEAETKEKKERAAKMFDSMSLEEQKNVFAAFKKSAKAKTITSKDVKAEIANTVADLKAKGITDNDNANNIASAILGFNVTDNKAIAAEVSRRNEEAVEAATAGTLEELDNDYKMFEAFAKMFSK